MKTYLALVELFQINSCAQKQIIYYKCYSYNPFTVKLKIFSVNNVCLFRIIIFVPQKLSFSLQVNMSTYGKYVCARKISDFVPVVKFIELIECKNFKLYSSL